MHAIYPTEPSDHPYFSFIQTENSPFADLLRQTRVNLSDSALSKIFIEDAIRKISDSSVVTEYDQYFALVGLVDLFDLFLIYCGNEPEAGSYKTYRAQYLEKIESLYSKASIYPWLIEAVQLHLHRLQQGMAIDDSYRESISSIAQLCAGRPPWQRIQCLMALGRCKALNLTFEWLTQLTEVQQTEDQPFKLLLANLLLDASKQGFSVTGWKDTLAQLLDYHTKHTGDAGKYAEALMLLFGLGILLNPDAFPGLDAIESQLIEAQPELYQQELAQWLEPDETKVSVQALLEEVVAQIHRDGFSQYALEQAIVALKQLPTDTEESYAVFQDALMQVFDIGIQYGDPAAVATLQVTKEVYLKFLKLVTMGVSLSIGELNSLSTSLLREMKVNLESGELPDVAIARAMISLQMVIPLLKTDDSEEEQQAVNRFLKSLFSDFLTSITAYLPEEKQIPFKEFVRAFGGGIDELLDTMDGPVAEQAVVTKKYEQEMSKFIQTSPQVLPISDWAMKIPHIRKFVELYPGLSLRLISFDHLGEENAEQLEFQKLQKDLDSTFRLLSSAYTEQQFLDQQKSSLRRMAVDLGRFEKRMHLMLVKPGFPVKKFVTNPNQLFYSGSNAVAQVIVTATQVLGMIMSSRLGLAQATHNRWTQLCESAMAVFDYTTYNPMVADGYQADLPPEQLETMLLAASETAQVAYENGLAIALGVPSLIIAKPNQVLPFDIDTEPEWYTGTPSDVDRVTEAIQVAFYGTNRVSQDACLLQTKAMFLQQYQHYTDAFTKAVVESVSQSNDAIFIRTAIETILHKQQSENQLCITPAFAGGYPKPGTKKLFHVTAFRPWSKPLEALLKSICNQRGIHYGIGYDRLDPEIMRAIWIDLCEASFVVVDVTSLNPNAVLELAMAQVLGKPLLIVCRHPLVPKYFTPLRKLRVHEYDVVNSYAALEQTLNNFLDGKS